MKDKVWKKIALEKSLENFEIVYERDKNMELELAFIWEFKKSN